MGYRPDCYYRDAQYDNDSVTCDCCTDSLSKLIRANFQPGDLIGLTFISEGVASIATGTFQRICHGVVVISNLFLENTTSFVPLCDISSVEKGITPAQTANGPVSVALTK